MGTKSRVLTALAVGAAVGGILGILFAPDKGTETRKKITERGKKMSDDVKEKFEKGKDIFQKVTKNGKEETAL
jgi:gas vesicle protein